MDPKIEKPNNDLCTHTNSSPLYMHKWNTNTMSPYVCLASTSRHPNIISKEQKNVYLIEYKGYRYSSFHQSTPPNNNLQKWTNVIIIIRVS
jgi:hypothetical protein